MSKDGRTDRQTDMTDGQTNLEVSETLILFFSPDATGQRCGVSIRGRSSHGGKCLVLLNPFGGKGRALNAFTEQVAPVLTEADMQYNMIVTERPGHAQELIQSIALEVGRWQVEMLSTKSMLSMMRVVMKK